MPETLGTLLERHAGAIAASERERAVLRRLLEPDGPVAAHVHGLAGVGKTALLRDVWGCDCTGGSNVVEVVISAGPRAPC